MMVMKMAIPLANVYSAPMNKDIDQMVYVKMYKAFEDLSASPELLAIIGALKNNSIPKEELLDMLQLYNQGLPTLHEIH